MSEGEADRIEALKQSIAVLEAQRRTLGDNVVDAALAPLKEKLAELETQQAELQTDDVERQRKLAVVLFADVVGSTAIGQQLSDPEAIIDVMDRALARMAAPVHEHGGHVTRFMGDGFKAVFGVPVAHEDDPDRAVRAGLDILAVVREVAQELEAQGIHGFNARVGIATGLVATGGLSEGGATVMGLTVNLAARLESAAPEGGLLISHETYRHVRGGFDIQASEQVTAKGFAEPVRAYRVLQAKAHSFHQPLRGVEGLETRMVGRAAELKYLQDALVTALETGEGQVITVSGEAGVGKSRLLEEFQNWSELRPERIRLYRGRARVEAQGLPYGLLREVFADRFEILENDSPKRMREKLVQGLQQGWHDQGEMKAHLLGQLLGYDFRESPHLRGVDSGEQLRNRGLMYLGEYFGEMTRQRPVVVLLEDIHWADDSTLDVVNWLEERMGRLRMLIVCAGRESLYERRPYWGEGEERHARVSLRPLTKRESRELVDEILRRVAHLPEDLRELVVENAEGNPFYLEELIKMLIEDGVIVKGEAAWRVEPERLQRTSVPSTLTGVLQARLDGLPAGERRVLQEASVVGRQFWDRVVAYLHAEGRPESPTGLLEERLSSLRGRELIFRRETSAFAEAREYLFKHDLLREVTYESVLKRVRQAHHALVADWLIDNAGGRIREYAGLIGEHLVLGGRGQEAVEYLLRAGEAALGAYSSREAERFYQRALDQDLSEAQQAMALQGLGTALGVQGRREVAASVLRQGIELSRKLGDTDRLAQTVCQLSWTLWRAELQSVSESWPVCRQAVEELGTAPDSPGLARLLHEAARTAYFAQQPIEIIVGYCRQAIDMAERLGMVDVQLNAAITLGLANPDTRESVRMYEQAAAQAEAHGLLEIASRAYFDLASTQQQISDYEAALEHQRKALELDSTLGRIPSVLFSLTTLAACYLNAGRLSEVPGLVAEALEVTSVPEQRARETRQEIAYRLSYYKGDWAQVLSMRRLSLADARQRSDLPAILDHNGWIAGCVGELADLSGQQDLSEAEAALRENIDTVRDNPLLGRTVYLVLGLAQILTRQGRLDEARALLAEGEQVLDEAELPGIVRNDVVDYRDETRFHLAQADNHWDEALGIAQSFAARYQQGGARWQRARWLIRVGDALRGRDGTGDGERARQTYQQALDLFTEMGADGYAQALHRRLESLRLEPPSSGSSHG
jgi:predicted ATPase/class 3 adenylate cyclase